MSDVVRRPSLDDYDRGNGGVFWAESIGAAAHPAYDRYELCENAPAARSFAEVKADAGAAEMRYQAHRERARLEEIEARKQREALLRQQAELQRKKREQEAELARTWAAQAAERQAQAATAARDAAERRVRWEAENAEWIAEERRRALVEAALKAKRDAEHAAFVQRMVAEQQRVQAEQWAEALKLEYKQAPALMFGGGRHIVRIVNKNVNIGSSIRLEIGEHWMVGNYWWERLVNDRYAETVASE